MTVPKSLTSRQRHPHSDRGDDLYETPPEATLALIRAERLPLWIWEPACGRGAISKVLREAGHEVLSTDLNGHGSSEAKVICNFFDVMTLPAGIQAIVTNPPFQRAADFVRHALGLCPLVYMLLRLTFLESSNRVDILDTGELARVLVFRNRLPMMHRDGWDGPRSTSTQAFAWFVWSRHHRGCPQLYRISWEPKNESLAPIDESE